MRGHAVSPARLISFPNDVRKLQFIHPVGPLALAKANVDVAQYGGTAHFVAQAVVA